jgi:carboxyl-terminal processing protease
VALSGDSQAGNALPGRVAVMKKNLLVIAAGCAAAVVALVAGAEQGFGSSPPSAPAAVLAAATAARPAPCAKPTTPFPPPPGQTTITTIGQAYYCVFEHYYSGSALDDRVLLQPAFAAFTQELQRRGLDRADATVPALTGDRDRDWSAFAAVYRRVSAELPADPAIRQAVAEATLSGMIGALHDDHALWQHGGPIRSTELGIVTNDVKGPAEADPAATAPLFVTAVLDGGPALAAGVKPGDVIVSVNGIPPFVDGVLDTGVLAWINDPRDPVTLVLRRPATGAVFSVTLTVPHGPPPGGGGPSSAPPPPPPGGGPHVTSRLLPGDLAYIQLPGFFPGATDQVLAALAKLRGSASSLRGLVLDLRDNTGGDDQEVAKLLGTLVHDKAFNYSCDFRGHCTPVYTDSAEPLLHLPLVTLTDRDCFSACDAFAATVKDLHLGTLVGARTGGMASGVAGGYVLDDNSELALPSTHALMADRESIDGIGVPPDYEAPLTPEALSAGHDPGIDKAVSLLR